MREILFRSKRVDNGEWVEGLFVHMNADPEMWIPFTDEEMERFKGHIFEKIRGVWVKVNRETIGQFTGLHDKNGKKIFEGDIVLLYCGIHGTYVMHILDIRHGFRPFENRVKEIEVIGNIHDNPELLEVKK